LIFMKLGMNIMPLEATLSLYFSFSTLNNRIRGSSGSMVSDYGLGGLGSIPTGTEDFSSSPCVQTGSGVHPASYPVGTRGPFPGGKAQLGRDADHSPPFSAKVKYE
jgi:hypothetical protein